MFMIPVVSDRGLMISLRLSALFTSSRMSSRENTYFTLRSGSSSMLSNLSLLMKRISESIGVPYVVLPVFVGDEGTKDFFALMDLTLDRLLRLIKGKP